MWVSFQGLLLAVPYRLSCLRLSSWLERCFDEWTRRQIEGCTEWCIEESFVNVCGRRVEDSGSDKWWGTQSAGQWSTTFSARALVIYISGGCK